MTDLLTKMQVLQSVASKKPDYASVSGSEVSVVWDSETHVEIIAELLDLNCELKVYSDFEVTTVYIDGEEVELDQDEAQLAHEMTHDWCLLNSDYLTEDEYREALEQDEHEAFYMNWERI